MVKQSWQPEEIKSGAKVERIPADSVFGARHASRDGKLYRAGKQADLYIMFQAAPKTAGTDNGWVYGTVTPEGKTVTSAGRVASCMNCHKDAKHDRLFGLAPAPTNGPAKTK